MAESRPRFGPCRSFRLPKPVDAWQVRDGAIYFAHRRTIVELVARQRVPAIYPHGVYVEAGGMMSYAADLNEQFRRAAAYVDRILRGARPAELPVEHRARQVQRSWRNQRWIWPTTKHELRQSR